MILILVVPPPNQLCKAGYLVYTFGIYLFEHTHIMIMMQNIIIKISKSSVNMSRGYFFKINIWVSPSGGNLVEKSARLVCKKFGE